MPDIATLGLKVENGDVIQATSSLNSMTVAGGKTEAAANRLTRRIALLEIEARNMDAAMTKAGSASARFAAEMQKQAAAAAEMERVLHRTDAAMQQTGRTATNVGGLLRSAFAALGIGITLRELGSLADSYTNLRARLGLVTTGTANLNAVQAALFETAQRTRASFEATADLYGRIARNAAGLGASQADILKVTEAVSKAMVISGSSAETSAAAIMQLGQAFASGRLQGDEFRSVMENAPVLAQAIARGLGVTTGELRKMSKEGTLTAQAVFDAIRKQGDALTTEFEKIPRTIGGAFQQIRNEILRTIGAENEMAGASAGIVVALDAIRNAIGPVARVISAFFGNFALGASEAAIWTEKLRQKTAEMQAGIALVLRATGQTKLGDALFGNAAKVLKDGGDITRMLEAQRNALVARLDATTAVGTVSSVAPPPAPPPPDLEALKKYKKLMEELRDVVKSVADAQFEANQRQVEGTAKSIASIQQEVAESELLLTAAKESEQAYKDQAREIEVLNKLTEAGLTLGDERYEQTKREIEQTLKNRDAIKEIEEAWKKEQDAAKKAADEAQRQMEQRAKDLHRTISRTIEGIFTDIDQHKNPFVALFENLKRGAIRAISDILATKFEARIADLLGIQIPASKQEKAAKEMNVAADKMLRAAEKMNPSGTDAGIPEGPFGKGGGAQASAMAKYLQQMLRIGGAAYGGYQVGYGIGEATGSRTIGVLGGAVSGAKLGGAIAGPIGAGAGALAGALGGWLGASDAAQKAAERLRAAQKAFHTAMDDFTATVEHNDVGRAIAAAKAQADAVRQAYVQTLQVLDFLDPERRKAMQGTLEEINRLEAERIAQLEREAAVLGQRRIEDYQQRLDEATPGNEQAEAIAAYNRKLDREIEDLITSFGPVIDANEAATLAVAQAAIAAEKEKFARDQATASLNAFTTSVNTVTGFKLADLNPYIQEFAEGRPRPGQLPLPTGGPGSPYLPTTPYPTLPAASVIPENTSLMQTLFRDPMVDLSRSMDALRDAYDGSTPAMPSGPIAPRLFASPQVSRTGTVATAPITVNVTVNESKTPQMTAEVVAKIAVSGVLTALDKEKNARDGVSGSRIPALDRLKLPPGGIPWGS